MHLPSIHWPQRVPSASILLLAAFPLALFFAITAFRNNATSSADATPPLPNRYTNSEYHFSFHYPAGFNVVSFDQPPYTVILLRKPGEDAFQLAVMPFDDSGPLTIEQLLDRVDTTGLTDPVTAELGDHIPAVILHEHDPPSADTRHIWFTGDHALYVVYNDAARSQWVDQILSSWRFEPH